MTAKKHQIQTMRKEIKHLESIVKGQREHIHRLDNRIDLLKRDKYFVSDRMADSAERLLNVFSKELTWQELASNPNKQLKMLRATVDMIRRDADRSNYDFLKNNQTNPNHKRSYNEILERRRIGK